MGGVVTADNKNEFKYTAYRKRDRVTSITGERIQMFFSATGFYRGKNKFLHKWPTATAKIAILSFNTGVSIIASDSRPSISGGLGENLVEESLIL